VQVALLPEIPEPQRAENRHFPLTRGIALTPVYALTCYTVIRATAAPLATWGVINWLSVVNKRWRLAMGKIIAFGCRS